MKTTIILVLFGLLLTSCAGHRQRQGQSFISSTPPQATGPTFVENGIANK